MERQNEFTWVLKGLENFYTLLKKVGWRYHDDNVQQDIGIFFEKQVYFLFNHLLKLFPIALRDAIPLFRFTIVTIVERWKHKIFVVPAKGRVFHTDVEPGDVYT